MAAVLIHYVKSYMAYTPKNKRFFFILAHLKDQLTDYMKAYSIVKIVRMPERVGLIRARLAGLPYSTAEVVTYLDSHCECTNGKSKSTFMMNKHYNDISSNLILVNNLTYYFII